jgi:serine/threonine protein kinase
MPKRAQKYDKFSRWCLYFPAKQEKGKVSTSLRVLRELVERGRAGVVYHAVSAQRVDLEWPRAVGWDSAARLCTLAREKCPTFEILGEPHGLEQTAAETPETCDSGAVSAEPQTTRRREDPTSDGGSGAVSAEPGGDALAAAGLPQQASPVASVAPALVVGAPAASAAPDPSASLRRLGIKLEHAGARFVHGSFGEYPFVYEVAWNDVLGAGRWAEVYAASPPHEEVAVKIFTDGPKAELVANAEAEMRRFTAAGCHPNIVSLLDVGLFARPAPAPPEIGLVYGRYDGTLVKILQLPLKWDGVQHVLRSVLAGLAHMHAAGLVHTDVKPENILLRGAGPHRRAWARALGRNTPAPARAAAAAPTNEDEAKAFTAHLPCTFEVRGTPPPVGAAAYVLGFFLVRTRPF